MSDIRYAQSQTPWRNCTYGSIPKDLKESVEPGIRTITCYSHRTFAGFMPSSDCRKGADDRSRHCFSAEMTNSGVTSTLCAREEPSSDVGQLKSSTLSLLQRLGAKPGAPHRSVAQTAKARDNLCNRSPRKTCCTNESPPAATVAAVVRSSKKRVRSATARVRRRKTRPSRFRLLSVSKKGWRPAKQDLLSAPTKTSNEAHGLHPLWKDNVQPEVIRTAG